MRELDPLRRLAPPVEPLAPDAIARIRAGVLAPRRRRLPAAGLLVPVAVAAAAVLVVVLGAGGADREVPAQAPTADAGRATPRLLLPGWRVSRADEWKVDSGEMTFTGSRGRELVLSWMPADVAGDIGKKPGVRPAGRVEVGGAQAQVWHPRPGDDYVAVWRDGAASLSARGRADSAEAFAAVVGGLERVDDAAWRSALPERAVTPHDQRAAVEKMVGEIPLPPGVDFARLASGATTRDRYQLVATVAGTIACGWITAWVNGDEPTRNRAEAVLGSARDWPMLQQIDAEGDYPEVLWQYADAVAGDGIVPGGKPGMTVEETYEAALCP